MALPVPGKRRKPRLTQALTRSGVLTGNLPFREQKNPQSVVRGEQHVRFAVIAGRVGTADRATIKTSWASRDLGAF